MHGPGAGDLRPRAAPPPSTRTITDKQLSLFAALLVVGLGSGLYGKSAPSPFIQQKKKEPPKFDSSIWRTDFGKAAGQAVHAGKPLCLFFYRSGNSKCRTFIDDLQASAEARKGLSGWVCLSIDEWDLSNQEVSTKYHIELVPQVVLLDVEGNELARQEDPISIPKLIQELARFGKPDIEIDKDSPVATGDEMPGSLRLVFHQEENVDHAKARIAPIGGKKVLEFIVGNPADEIRANVDVVGWGDPEKKGERYCRNSDQTGVGDGKGGFAYLGIPIENKSGSYRIYLYVWGKSNDPNTRYRTWLKHFRCKTGPEKTDWGKFHFKRTEPLKTDRYCELICDLPAEALPILDGRLLIGLGEGDQQIWLSKVQVFHFVDENPPKLADQ